VTQRWTTREVPTSQGPARVRRRTAARGRPWLVLGHGAGGGIEAPDLQAMAVAGEAHGFGVVLVEQPWRVAGRRVAPHPAALDAAWCECLAALRLPGPVVLGGRSAGARVASRTAGALRADAVVALAFPLHPPGRPDRSRADELTAVTLPLLVVQGGRDPFGTATEVSRAVPGAIVHEVPGADHALRSPALADAVERVAAFVTARGE
jgi:uncharacterized protein